MKLWIVCGLALAGLAAAQQPAPEAAPRPVPQPGPQPGPMVSNVRYFTSRSADAGAVGMALASVVKGAPYSAEWATETVQALADGNRIVNTTSGKTYRDSEGRTRLDQTSAAAGAWVPADRQFSITNIDDPVSGEHMMLNNATKQATKFPKSMFVVMPAPEGTDSAGSAAAKKTLDEAAARGGAKGMVMVANPATMAPGMPPPPALPAMPMQVATASAGVGQDFFYYRSTGTVSSTAGPIPIDRPKTESLGTKTIEGVLCTGTRETVTIPAGAIGNEREIQTVTEHWYSADLQTDVSSKTSDPRFGETTYKLTNIVRGEQPKSLFEAPADYTTAEAVTPMPPKLQGKQ